MSNALAVQHNQSKEVYIPTEADWKFMLAWGAQAVKSGMLPTSIKSQEAAAIIVLKGRELGLSFMTAIAHIHVINGKPSMSAELMQAMARKNLPGLLINVVEATSQKATVKFKRPEEGSEWFTFSFSMEDAAQAELLKNPSWKKYPRAMLWSRAVSAGLRIVCPEALMGVSYTPEELGANVDESGNVVETTGRHLNNDSLEDKGHGASTENKRKEGSVPLTSTASKTEDINAKVHEGAKIKALRTELGISEVELLEEVHRELGVGDIKKLTLEQMRQVTSLLQAEKSSRDSHSPQNDKTAPEEEAPWLKEASLGFPPPGSPSDLELS